MKSGGFHFQRLRAGIRSVPTLSTTHWLNTEATLMASKSVMKSVIDHAAFQKSLQTNGEVHPELTFID
jgi:hypothetical protein